MLFLLPDRFCLALLQLSILPGDFSLGFAASVLGHNSAPTIASMMLRHLHDLGLVEMSAGPNMWRLQSSVRHAAADLAVQLQLPLISVR